jgi:nodulation protein E
MIGRGGTRIAITGVGTVSAAGVGMPALLQALRDGVSRLLPSARLTGAEWAFSKLGEARDLPAPQESRTDRVTQLALTAMREAVRDAGFFRREGLRIGVILGTGGGGLETIDAGYQQVFVRQRHRPAPLTIPMSMPSAAPSAIAAELGLSGPVLAVSSACSSANHAIALGASLIANDTLDAAIVGGAEAPLSFGHMRAWEALHALSPDTCRPFSADRSGFVLAEGAGVLVLEAMPNEDRPLWGELLGAGTSSGGHDLTKSDASSYVAAMRRALEDAELARDDVDYLNAHGTGTAHNDAAEAQAIHALFGARAATLPCSSTKSIVGHAIGASGAIELAATLLGMRYGFFPPTLNYRKRDPACALDVVPNEARPGRIRVAMSNSFAFGDSNAVLVVGAASER